MTVHVERLLYCDGIGNEPCALFDGPANVDSIKQIPAAVLRAEFHKDGWITVGNRDYCPKCAAARKGKP